MCCMQYEECELRDEGLKKEKRMGDLLCESKEG